MYNFKGTSTIYITVNDQRRACICYLHDSAMGVIASKLGKVLSSFSKCPARIAMIGLDGAGNVIFDSASWEKIPDWQCKDEKT